MADYDEEPQDQQPESNMHPALQAFKDAFPPDAQEQPWVQDVTTRLNDWVQRRDMADANTAASNQYVSDIGNFKSGLVDMVTADPTATHAALDVVPPTVHGLLPYDFIHPDKHEETHSALTGDIQNQIVHAAVASMARRDGGAARSLLGDDRVSALLSDDEKTGLSGYIQAHEIARGADANAAQREGMAQQARQQAAAMHGYASAMVNAFTGGVDFPKGWGQKLTDDPNLRPEDRGELMHLFGRLQTTGDGPSHPQVLTEALQDIAQGRLGGGSAPTTSVDLLGRVGINEPNDRLSLKDAVWLNGLLNTENTDGRVQVQNLADTVAKAQAQIMGRDNEYGAAGFNAFGRFMNWFVPAYQKAGPGGLDPQHESFLFNGTNVNSFRPTGDDLVLGSRAYSGSFHTPETGDARMSLGDLFGRPSGQRQPPVKMPTTDYGPDKDTSFYKNPEINT